jgi:Ca2+-binding EF-hand superfamily protein|tara:strand:+ start:1313 stop:1417 length:105 start_codon:yes stop_codon:yes gene_type:complete
MSYEEVRELFAEFDHDGSGALEEEELLAFMKSQI